MPINWGLRLNMLNKMDYETVFEIKELISQHAHLSVLGESKAANTAFKKYTLLIGRCLASDSGFTIAEILLSSSIPVHRYVGAYYLLPYQPRRASCILRQLFPVKEDFLGTNAKTLYHEWKQGRLKFPIISTDMQTIIYVDSKTYLEHILMH
jgi:hypothetical protein